MTQRNYQNARYQENGRKGTTRKSASSAKPKSKAGNSVYVSNSKVKTKEQVKEEKAQRKEQERELRDRMYIAEGAQKMDSYKKWRRVWLVLIILAVVGVAASWISSYFMTEGAALEQFAAAKEPVMYVGLAVGYICIIAALVIDFKFIRPIRKAGEALSRRESKKERQHREEAEAERASKPKFWQKKSKE